MKKKILKKALLVLILLFIFVAVLTYLVYNGILKLNNPSKSKYPIRGVDVSSYQGEIDWNVLSSQDIDFAFIKATEGSSFVDDYFKDNWNNASQTNLKVGAYHFFSFDSEGSTQAENYINTVPFVNNMLPPVIDVEYYYGAKNKDKELIRKELKVLVQELKEHYGVNPIIYCSKESYNDFIKGDFNENPLWFRNVIMMPRISDGRDWTFWQYTDKEKLEGYNGKEKYIDMNVFYGSKEQFEELIIK